MRDLNHRFRGKDYATNVLSFPAPENRERHLGDIALAFGVCAREAEEQGKSLAHHLQHLACPEPAGVGGLAATLWMEDCGLQDYRKLVIKRCASQHFKFGIQVVMGKKQALGHHLYPHQGF